MAVSRDGRFTCAHTARRWFRASPGAVRTCSDRRFVPVSVLALCLFLWSGVAVLFAFDPLADRALAAKVDKANKAFHDGKYEEALKGYTDAQLSRPDSPDLQFDIGTVHYKTGRFDEAAKAFQEALATDDPSLKAAAYYNLGNTFYRQGASKGDMGKLREAIESYKKCLKVDPDFVDAKYNIEYIQRKLKENARRKQGGGKKSGGGGKRRNKEDDRKKNEGKKGKDDKKDGKSPQCAGKKKNDRKKDAASGRKSGDDKKKRQAGRPGDDRKRLDPEQARRWLDMLKNDERKQLRRNMRRRGGGERGEVACDW